MSKHADDCPWDKTRLTLHRKCTCGADITPPQPEAVEGEGMETVAWPLSGYAPGNYECPCYTCGRTFTGGDKRATECLPCAVEATKRLLSQKDAEAREAYHKGYSARDGVVDACRARAEAAEGEIERLKAANEALMVERAILIETKRDQLAALKAERDEARHIVREIHWMAVRYADGRKTYAPGMCNDALRKAYDAGWLTYNDDGQHSLDPQYARDGDRPEYRTIEARAEAAEARIAELEGALCRDLNVTDEELVRIINSGVGRESVLIWTKMLMKIVDAVRRARALLSPETKE